MSAPVCTPFLRPRLRTVVAFKRFSQRAEKSVCVVVGTAACQHQLSDPHKDVFAIEVCWFASLGNGVGRGPSRFRDLLVRRRDFGTKEALVGISYHRVVPRFPVGVSRAFATVRRSPSPHLTPLTAKLEMSRASTPVCLCRGRGQHFPVVSSAAHLIQLAHTWVMMGGANRDRTGDGDMGVALRLRGRSDGTALYSHRRTFLGWGHDTQEHLLASGLRRG